MKEMILPAVNGAMWGILAAFFSFDAGPFFAGLIVVCLAFVLGRLQEMLYGD